jgi:hypothetical protein
MNLTNVNLYNGFRAAKYLNYFNSKQLPSGFDWLLDALESLKGGKLVEFPAFNGKHLTAIDKTLGLKEFKSVYAYERRIHFYRELEKLPQRLHKVRQNPIYTSPFRPVECDVLISIDYLQSELNPVEWINTLLTKFHAKNVFILFDIVADEISSELEDANCRIVEYFSNGKYIQNRYNESALEEIASQTGLELKIIRDYGNDSAILYRTEKLAKKTKSEPVEEATVEEEKTTTKKRVNNVSKTNKTKKSEKK